MIDDANHRIPLPTTMPFDEHEFNTNHAAEHVAVIYCTLCGHRWPRRCEAGDFTTTWRMTATEIRTMRRELAKMRCAYCDSSVDLRILDADERSASA